MYKPTKGDPTYRGRYDYEGYQEAIPHIFKRDGFVCQICGKKPGEKYADSMGYIQELTHGHYLVHHIDGDPRNQSWKNLQVVCDYCNRVERKILRKDGWREILSLLEKRKNGVTFEEIQQEYVKNKAAIKKTREKLKEWLELGRCYPYGGKYHFESSIFYEEAKRQRKINEEIYITRQFLGVY